MVIHEQKKVIGFNVSAAGTMAAPQNISNNKMWKAVRPVCTDANQQMAIMLLPLGHMKNT